MALSDIQIATVARQAGFPADQIATAVAVCLAESGGDPLSVNINGGSTDAPGSKDLGLWQINDRFNADALAMGDWRDPATNARMALHAFQGRGWKDWTTFVKGRHLQYMARGQAAAAATGGVTASTTPAGLSIPVPGLPFSIPMPGNPFSIPLPGVDALANIAELLKNTFAYMSLTAAWVSNPDNWMRMLKAGAGLGVLLVGLALVAKPVVAPAVKSGVNAGKKAAKVGKTAAKVAAMAA